MERTYEVQGMTCGGCVKAVTHAVSAALPQAKVEVSLEDHSVRVEGEHDEAAVKEAVEDAGFDFAGARQQRSGKSGSARIS
ncbi:MAG: heavy-metal-associated domain-containing protein [Myxococcota bacterium]